MDGFVNSLLQFFYPAHCRNCQIMLPKGIVFCGDCAASIKPVVSIFLPLTKAHSLKVFSVSAYQDPLKGLLLKKFSGDIVASKQLGKLMVDMSSLHELSVDVIVPIPLHWTRYARRGFNQACEIGCVIGKEIDRPVMPALRRCKRTVFQSRLSSELRQENVKDAFALSRLHQMFRKNSLEGKDILLVDDLCTTGATLRSAAKVLLACKPKSITALVACRTI